MALIQLDNVYTKRAIVCSSAQLQVGRQVPEVLVKRMRLCAGAFSYGQRSRTETLAADASASAHCANSVSPARSTHLLSKKVTLPSPAEPAAPATPLREQDDSTSWVRCRFGLDRRNVCDVRGSAEVFDLARSFPPASWLRRFFPPVHSIIFQTYHLPFVLLIPLHSEK